MQHLGGGQQAHLDFSHGYTTGSQAVLAITAGQAGSATTAPKGAEHQANDGHQHQEGEQPAATEAEDRHNEWGAVATAVVTTATVVTTAAAVVAASGVVRAAGIAATRAAGTAAITSRR